jgi:TRAP-type mannitol/chloroaromatic compound transport system permease small subunit
MNDVSYEQAKQAAPDIRPYAKGEEPFALKLSDALRWFVDKVGKAASWLALPLILVTVIDVVARKLTWRDPDLNDVVGLQPFLIKTFGPVFGSTLLQELEWHFHAALFALVLGYGYINNTHVRVDLIRENLSFRKKAWIEFLGTSCFMIPYCLIVTYFAWIYAHDSYLVHEVSASTVGLSHRWIIKSILVAGLIIAGMSGIAVWLQTVVLLWGDPNRRFELMTVEWPEEEGSKIEGKERLRLDDAPDLLAQRTAELNEKAKSDS